MASLIIGIPLISSPILLAYKQLSWSKIHAAGFDTRLSYCELFETTAFQQVVLRLITEPVSSTGGIHFGGFQVAFRFESP